VLTARIAVVELSATLTPIPLPESSAEVPVANGAPLQSLVANSAIVDPASALP
jgi:hypothetical protein